MHTKASLEITGYRYYTGDRVRVLRLPDVYKDYEGVIGTVCGFENNPYHGYSPVLSIPYRPSVGSTLVVPAKNLELVSRRPCTPGTRVKISPSMHTKGYWDQEGTYQGRIDNHERGVRWIIQMSDGAQIQVSPDCVDLVKGETA